MAMEQDAVEKSIVVVETAEDISQFIASLPLLSLDQLKSSDPCPICLMPFSSIISESLDGKPNGITMLKCGHVFCLSDISEWINTPRGSCPTCRDMFLVIPEVSEGESSDGGEYVPGSDLTDDFMDEDYWTEDEEEWTDGEIELFESNTSGESNSSWDSEQHMDEANAPAHGQILSMAESSYTASTNNPYLFENLTNEISQLKTSVHCIQPSDFLYKKEHVKEALNNSLLKTREMKRLLNSQGFTTSSAFQSISETLQEIEDTVRDLLASAGDCD